MKMLRKVGFCCYALGVLSTISVIIAEDAEKSYFVGDGIPKNDIEKQLSEPSEPGPLPEDILRDNPNIKYVGKVENKNYYIERKNVTWPEGNETCNDLGMKMATFHKTSESDYIYKKLPESDGIVWTGAKIRHNYSHYRWVSDGSSMFSTNLWAFNNTDTVLVFDVRKDTPSSNMFTVSLMDNQFYTLCFV